MELLENFRGVARLFNQALGKKEKGVGGGGGGGEGGVGVIPFRSFSFLGKEKGGKKRSAC